MGVGHIHSHRMQSSSFDYILNTPSVTTTDCTSRSQVVGARNATTISSNPLRALSGRNLLCGGTFFRVVITWF